MVFLSRKLNFFLFFLACLLSNLQADEFLGLQDRITEVFKQKKDAVVSVFGFHTAPSNTCNVPTQMQQVDVGTGFFISREGHVMTIADVVDDASCIMVEYNGVPYQAELVGYDDITNIAIVRICKPPSNITFLHLGESIDVPSPSVILLGVTCKLGMDPGPSMGMVTGWHTAFLDKFFPTTYLRSTIPSDGGESGSPVFDLSGRFVGVMIWSYPPIRSSFIIPARAVMRIRDDLVFSGKVSYAFFGVELDQEATLAAGIHLIIGRVIEGGPADEAGLKSGDKILEFNNTPINYVMDLHNTIFFARPGQLLPIKIQRGDKELKLVVRLKEQPAVLCIPDPKPVEPIQNAPLAGPNSEVSISQDAVSKIKEITQKSDRWRNYFKPD